MKNPTITTHYEQLIGLQPPWHVKSVDISHEHRRVEIRLERRGSNKLLCPECGVVSSRYDGRERRWRHLDTMQYQTILMAEVPRVECKEHGVKQVEVPWSEPRGRFTAMFEVVVIDWLLAANLSDVARQLGLSWDQVSEIQARAVKRGLARRGPLEPEAICVDETSSARGREYVTVVSEVGNSRVLYVGDDRRATSLAAFYQELGPESCSKLQWVGMDMWGPFIKATKMYVPEAEDRIVFDWFHIAQYLTEAVDRVRRRENKELLKRGDDRLSGTRFLWLFREENLNREARASFVHLKHSRLKVAKAWHMKEVALGLCGYMRKGWAARMWKKWAHWVLRSQLNPMKRVAETIIRHFYGVVNAASCPITNASAEALNGGIQVIKRKARGLRNRERFKNAIYLHFGGLDLYPEGAKIAHTKP